MNKKTAVQENLITPSIDSLLKKVENKYILALLSAKRARELFDGKRPLIKDEYINKVTTAIFEIDAEKVTYENRPESQAEDLEGDEASETTEISSEAQADSEPDIEPEKEQDIFEQ